MKQGDKITYAYGSRAVHGLVGKRYSAHPAAFMAWPAYSNDSAIGVSQYDDYEGVTWERGWTDGVALLAAHALLQSR